MAVIYRIRVKNHLDTYRAHWFGEMTFTNLENGEAELVGPIEDQESLHGLLDKIRDLNMTLVNVERLEDASSR